MNLFFILLTFVGLGGLIFGLTSIDHGHAIAFGFWLLIIGVLGAIATQRSGPRRSNYRGSSSSRNSRSSNNSWFSGGSDGGSSGGSCGGGGSDGGGCGGD